MKKLCSTLLLLSFFCHLYPMVAQQNKFEMGIIGGPNAVKLVGNKLIETYYKRLFLYSAGISIQYNFPKRISFQSGLLDERKGCGDKNISVTDEMGRKIGTAKLSLNFDYLVLPLIAKASFGKKTKFFFSWGTFLAYCLTSELNYSSTLVIGYSRNLGSQYKKQDAGIMIGGGLDFPIYSKLSFSAEYRYCKGLHDIATDEIWANEKVLTISNNLLLGIQYKFGLRK